MPQQPQRVTRAAIAITGVGIAVYVLAVFIRSSLSVAGLVAAERFGINASQLSSFMMVQLLIYAAMQIPVGLLVDRFGPRRLLITGLSIITLSEIGFALATTFPAALLSRVFIGGGDALIFISALRLVNSWFPPGRVPLATQGIGFLGQVGSMAAAVPMTLALRQFGWTPTYLLPAGLGAGLLVALVLLVRDAPGTRVHSGPPISPRRVAWTLRDVWSRPGTRLGFWTHFSCPFAVTSFSLLWGYPFLVQGQGRSPVAAGSLLTVATLASVVSAPIIGQLVGRRPFHRSTMVLGVLVSMMLGWGAVLVWPGPAPTWVLVAMVLVIGVGGPASMIGFDYARTSNPPDRLGGATGVINQGGFIAALLTVLAIGVILDWRTPDGQAYTRSAFVAAMSFQYLPWLIGVVQVLRYRQATRQAIRARDPEGYERFRHGDLSVDWSLATAVMPNDPYRTPPAGIPRKRPEPD